MPGAEAFQYAVLQVVPDIERDERLNAGVVLYARRHGFLAARAALDEARLAALAPGADAAPLVRQLDGLVRVAAGDPAAGPIAALPQSERFAWLVAPASTAIQPTAVHTGLCEDPVAALDRLFARLVGPAA